MTLNVSPCWTFISLIQSQLIYAAPLTVAEIGIDQGATSAEVARILRPDDKFYILDFEYKVAKVKAQIAPINEYIEIIACGNTNKTYDSYGWTLAKLYIDVAHKSPLFDLAYLDAAHTFIHDASALCVLKELCKPGGFIVLDDIKWSFAASPTCNPKINPGICDQFTEEQINTSQVQLVSDIILSTDSRFKKITMIKHEGERSVWQKIGDRL